MLILYGVARPARHSSRDCLGRNIGCGGGGRCDQGKALLWPTSRRFRPKILLAASFPAPRLVTPKGAPPAQQLTDGEFLYVSESLYTIFLIAREKQYRLF